MAIFKVMPGVIPEIVREVVKVFEPVPTATEDLVSPIMRPEPPPSITMALLIVTGVDQSNVPAGIVIVSPSCAKLSCRYWILAAVPSEL